MANAVLAWLLVYDHPVEPTDTLYICHEGFCVKTLEYWNTYRETAPKDLPVQAVGP
jgi:hypothetical protein